MDCEQIQNQLSALVDRQLDAESAVAVEAHLADCEICRAQKESLMSLDASLSRVFAPQRSGADRIADGVLDQLSAADPEQPGGRISNNADRPVASWRRGLGYLIAVAAGFLLAVLWYRPGDSLPDPGAQIADGSAEDSPIEVPLSEATPVALLVHTTGELLYRPPAVDQWQAVDQVSLQTFACPSEGSVKTQPGALCELETTGGSRIRLNESSEVAFRSEDLLELKQGQIWCRASDNESLQVVTGDDSPAFPPPELLTVQCASSGECVTRRTLASPMQVVSAAGDVSVTVGGTQRTLPAGAVGTLSDGDLQIRESEPDVIQAQRWMQPLLTLGGHGNPELTQRVDALLARVGRTKLAYLYEQDLRNLGEYGALPLMKFVQSEASRQEPVRRRTAMHILTDTAPIWMLPDLIALLEDEDAQVRVAAARGLTRLTGQRQGLEPEQWAGERAELSAGLARWQQWWQEHRYACPAPPKSVKAEEEG